MDYRQFRLRLKQVTELRDKIADTSAKLAGLLRNAANTGFSYWPSEFFSIPALLRKTDNHKMQNHDLRMWQGLRRYVLGDIPERKVPESEPLQEEGESAITHVVVWRVLKAGEKPEIDPEEEVRNSLRYAWGTAPDVSELLDTVAKAARDFKPSENGMMVAAIDSRKSNLKAEYLRAFGNLLTDVHHFTLTTGIMQAMATVANVAINQPEIDVSYDDVRKASCQARQLVGGRFKEKKDRESSRHPEDSSVKFILNIFDAR